MARVFLAILAGFARDAFEFCMTENDLAKQIVDAAYRVHTSLGPGLLESAYEAVWRSSWRIGACVWPGNKLSPSPITAHGLKWDFGQT